MLEVGDCSAIAVTSGTVKNSNVGQAVMVPENFGNIGCKDTAPGAPFKVDYALTLKNVRVEETAVGTKITAKINPLNKLVVEGVESTGITGKISAISQSKKGNSLRLTVVAPDNTMRTFYYPLQRRN